MEIFKKLATSLLNNKGKVAAAGATVAGAAALINNHIQGVKAESTTDSLVLKNNKTGKSISFNLQRLKEKGYTPEDIVKLAKYWKKHGTLPEGIVRGE